MLKKNILIIDDDEIAANIVKSYLEEGGFKVYTALNGKQVLNLLDKVMPALIMLHLMVHDISSEIICTLLREKCNVPVIILSEKANEDDILNGCITGADDYIIKPINPVRLVAKVVNLLVSTTEKPIQLTKEVSFNNGELLIDTLKHQVKKNGKEIKITPNEYKLLICMINYSKVFTREELLVKAFGNDYEGGSRVIDTHIKNLRQKIEIDPKSPRYILTIQGVGYRFERG